MSLRKLADVSGSLARRAMWPMCVRSMRTTLVWWRVSGDGWCDYGEKLALRPAKTATVALDA
jgi:hypothetical protein